MSEPEINRTAEQLRETLAGCTVQLTPEVEPALTLTIEVEEDRE